MYYDREEFLKKFNADCELELKVLNDLRELVKGIETETCYKFKTRLNARKNKSLVITSGNLYRKIDVLVDSDKEADYTTVCSLDKEGYETAWATIHINELTTPKELALKLLQIEEDKYDDSARVKAY